MSTEICVVELGEGQDKSAHILRPGTTYTICEQDCMEYEAQRRRRVEGPLRDGAVCWYCELVYRRAPTIATIDDDNWLVGMVAEEPT